MTMPASPARPSLRMACISRLGPVGRQATRRHAQRGQAMTEYIVAVGFLLLLLWVGANTSTVQQLVAALKNFWTHYSYLISLP